jgi:hypothetical protein
MPPDASLFAKRRSGLETRFILQSSEKRIDASQGDTRSLRSLRWRSGEGKTWRDRPLALEKEAEETPTSRGCSEGSSALADNRPMGVSQYLEVAAGTDDGSQEHDSLLSRENPQTGDGESKGRVCLCKRIEETSAQSCIEFTVDRQRDMRAVARVLQGERNLCAC